MSTGGGFVIERSHPSHRSPITVVYGSLADFDTVKHATVPDVEPPP